MMFTENFMHMLYYTLFKITKCRPGVAPCLPRKWLFC